MKEFYNSIQLVEKPQNFTIPIGIYLEMVQQILGIEKIEKENVLSLVQFTQSVKQKTSQICEEYGYKQEELLERTYVGLRVEKQLEFKRLLEFGKNNYSHIQFKTEENLVEYVKQEIEKKTNIKLVYWPDESINYIESYNKWCDEFNEKISTAEGRARVGKEIRSIHGVKTKTLSKEEKLDLEECAKKAAKRRERFDFNQIEGYLKGHFDNYPKMFGKRAQEYFYKKYELLYKENYGISELFPNDRKIVEIQLTKNKEHVCTVRGEKEIISIVINKLNSWKISLKDYIQSDIKKKVLEVLIQKLIDEYYHYLRIYTISTIGKDEKLRFIALDLEKLGGNISIIKDGNVFELSSDDIKNELLGQAKKRTENLKKKSKISENNSNLDNIDEFNGFDSILDQYREYFLEGLQSDNIGTLRLPSRINILKKMGFIHALNLEVLKKGNIYFIGRKNL